VLVRRGGLVVLDNTVFFGRVVDEEHQDRDTATIRELNVSLLADDRVDLAMLSFADGLTLAVKR
jgi:O-methyltransferase